MRAVKFLAVVGIMVAAVGQTQPATQPAPVNPVIKTLNTISKDMWPVAGETTTHADARSKLIVTVFPKGTKVPTLTGKLIDTAEEQIPVFNPGPRPAGALGLKPDSIKSMQEVSLDCGTIELWGSPAKVTATALVDVAPAVGRGWIKGQELTITGELLNAPSISTGFVQMRLGESKLVPPPKPKPIHDHAAPVATTAPASVTQPGRSGYTYPTQP